MKPIGYKDETVINDPNENSKYWDSEFDGEGVKPSDMNLAKVVICDYASPEQIEELEAKLDSRGVTLAHSKTMIKYLAQVGDRLLANQDERETSPSNNFFGSEMDEPVAASVAYDADQLINSAIDKAISEITTKSKRSIPGRLARPK